MGIIIRSIFTFTFFYFSFCLVFGDTIEKNWYKGEVILTDGNVLKGKINYNINTKVVRLKNGTKIKAFTPYSVSYFTFFDQEREKERVFTSQNFIEKIGFVNNTFLELLIDGPIVVLRDGEYVSFNGQTSHHDGALKAFYYISVGQKTYMVNNFKKDVMPFMSAYESKINSFIHDQRINLTKPNHQIFLIDYFNHLVDPEYKWIGSGTDLE
ncbi:hypothetical protein [Flexithrix dorotheae]|uniref:hypothetical protein n=1 Tax=Flexithrix dorotheae TaxID=70993 RepID=UPI000375F874|nr:hypothetical protein [Flexithrix dorotheae]